MMCNNNNSCNANKYEPKLKIPYEALKGENVNDLYKNNLIWLRKFNFSDEHLSYLLEKRVHNLAARLTANADSKRAALMLDFLTWTQLLEAEIQRLKETRSSALNELIFKNLITILEHNLTVKIGQLSPLQASLADIWSRLRALSNADWQAKFQRHFRQMSHAQLKRLEFASAEKVCSLVEYFSLKQYCDCSFLIIDLLEIIGEFTLSNELIGNEIIRNLISLVSLQFPFLNDIRCQAEKFKCRDKFNLIEICKREYKLPFHGLIHKLSQVHDFQTEIFDETVKYLPRILHSSNSSSPSSSSDGIVIEKFISYLKLLMGCYKAYLYVDLAEII